jgi:nuclear pore complex protein Nup155
LDITNMFATNQQTPQRPLPGGFINTPAPNLRQQSSYSNPPPPTFRIPSQQAVQQRQAAPSQSQSVPQQSQQNGMSAPPAITARDLSPVELAKNAINEKLEAEGRFPPLEEYIGRTLAAYI